MLALVCSTPACPGLLVVVRFSCGPPMLRFGVLLSSQDLLVGKLPPLCWLAALRGAGGALGCCRFRQIWLPFVFCRRFRTGCQSQARGGGVSLFCARFDRVLVLAVRVCVALRLQLFLRMRLRLLYLCLRAWPPCCRSVVDVVVCLDVSGSGRARDASVLQGRSRGTRWKASCELVSMLGFCTKCQCFSLICYERPTFCASPCWLAALWLLQVQANLVALRVLPTLQNGVSVLGSRWGGQPVLRSLCALQVAVVLFEARLSGCCVRDRGGQGSQPWVLSACL